MQQALERTGQRVEIVALASGLALCGAREFRALTFPFGHGCVALFAAGEQHEHDDR